MDAIHRQFKDGASMTRLSRKHSLPKSTIEFIIRMKMIGHANDPNQRPGTQNAMIATETLKPGSLK